MHTADNLGDMRPLTHLFMNAAPWYLAEDHASCEAAPDECAPCYLTNLAAPSFVPSAKIDELQ
jgi:hypothetical protein